MKRCKNGAKLYIYTVSSRCNSSFSYTDIATDSVYDFKIHVEIPVYLKKPRRYRLIMLNKLLLKGLTMLLHWVLTPYIEKKMEINFDMR